MRTTGGVARTGRRGGCAQGAWAAHFSAVAALCIGGLCSGVLATGARGQQTSSWVRQVVPGGLPAEIPRRGKLQYMVDGTDLRVFSAFTRAWHSWPLPSGANLRHANDWVLIDDGMGEFTAFSSMRGTFERLVLSPNAYVMNPPSQGNDSIVLVRDDGQLWAFSGLRGHWVSLAVSPTAAASVLRQVAIVTDGTRLLGLSPFAGGWVGRDAGATTGGPRAEGLYGVASTASELWAFSAQTKTWAREPLPAGYAEAFGHDCALWDDGSDTLGYSALRGAFVRGGTGGGAALQADQQLALATNGSDTWLFSAPTGRWTYHSTAGVTSVELGAATALFVGPTAVDAYSAIRDSLATRYITPGFWEASWAAAVVVDATTQRSSFYSAFTGAWHDAPAGPPATVPRVSTNGGLIETHAGHAAFSARSGRFVEVATGPGAIAVAEPASSILTVREPNALHVFEPRRELWLTQATRGGPLSLHVWRTSMVAVEPGRAYGFGAQHGQIETLDFTGNVLEEAASSESGVLATATEVFGYSAVPDLISLWQFPEFRRMFARGSQLELQLRGPPQAAAAAFFAAPAPTPAPTPLGPLLLAPTPYLVMLPLGVVPGEGTLAAGFPIPNSPFLTGFDATFQGALLPLSGGAYLTRLCNVAIF
ncbi:MAG: hypothetical protein AAF628_34895 [Planctomycetota bacterium]